MQDTTLDWTCPITLEPFNYPLFLFDDGFTYEKTALETWVSKNPKITPMGFPSKSWTVVKNISVLNRETKCPLTKEPFQDPVIVAQTGQTYERYALEELVKRTLGDNQHLGLSSKQRLFEIHAYSNKFYPSNKRQLFEMPEIKRYPAYTSNISRSFIYGTLCHPIDLNEVDNFRDESDSKIKFINDCRENEIIQENLTKNKIYSGFVFRKNCVKDMSFFNCKFIDCVFDECCNCSQFYSCKFEKCKFIRHKIHGNFKCPGTIFEKCLFIDLSDMPHFKSPTEYSSNGDYIGCNNLDDVVKTFLFFGAIDVDIQVYTQHDKN